MIKNTFQHLSGHIRQIHTLGPEIILDNRNMAKNSGIKYLTTFLLRTSLLTPTTFTHAHQRANPLESLVLGENASLVGFLQAEIEVGTVLRFITNLYRQ